MRQLHITLFILTFFSLHYGLSNHIIGGNITYTNISPNNYTIRVEVYKDCEVGFVGFDNPLHLTLFNALSLQALETYKLNPLSTQDITDEVNGQFCDKRINSICIEKAIYELSIYLPGANDGYYLSYQRCCRDMALENIENPAQEGITLTTFIPDPNSIPNSAPLYVDYAVIAGCEQLLNTNDLSATDSEGDSLVYSLVTPYTGANTIIPMPNSAAPPPYTTVNYVAGHTTSKPLGVGSDHQIDQFTGILSYTPYSRGKFTFTVEIKEYRNKNLIASHRRDIVCLITDCFYESSVEIVPLTDMAKKPICGETSLQFETQTTNGITYHWDFGDGNLSNIAKPQHTYPNTGPYTATLTINAGTPCADTSSVLIAFSPDLNMTIAMEDTLCSNETLELSYFTENHDTLIWATNGLQINVTSDTTALLSSQNQIEDQTVSLTAIHTTCQKTVVHPFYIVPEPASLHPLRDTTLCEGEAWTHSLPESPMMSTHYLWYMNNEPIGYTNNLDTLLNPGMYSIKSEYSVAHCNDTVFQQANITVHPLPLATTSVTQNPYDLNQITIIVDTEDSYNIDLDSLNRSTSDTTYTYLTSGKKIITTTVLDTMQCSLTLLDTIYIPQKTILYIPNSFTPNGDGLNDIFKVEVTDIRLVSFSIQNRWGDIVYTTTELPVKWDGSYKGGIMSGTYLYSMKFVNDKGNPEIVQGHLIIP